MSGDFTIHPLRDRVCLREEVARHLWAQWGIPQGQTLAERLAMVTANSLDNPEYQSFVALDAESGAFVGTASYVRHDRADRLDLHPWLASVYTRPQARHRGIGRALVQTVEDYARRQGTALLWLYTPDKMHFYEQMGWVRNESFENTLGTQIMMTKALSPAA